MASSLHPKEKSLGKVLRDALQHSDFSNREFLPHDAFNDIKKEWDVPQELASRKIDDKDGVLTKFISEKSPKTFAILIRARLGTHAARLAEYGFTDRYLPVQYEHGKITSRSGIPADDPALRWFLTWEEKNNPDADVETNINEFCRHQWEFLAPIFAAGAVIEELHDDHVLPLFEYVQRGGGGFSTLYQARIHKAHRGDLIKVDQVAIKELLESESGSENAFDGEVNALDLARSLNHRHIVNFLAAFKWRTKRYMMFQWVDGGNLREFWNNNSRGDEVTIGHTIKWALTELHGLAEALDKWHNYFKDSPRNCRHGDLKPENIIRAKEDGSLGCLQIADLGLAKIHSLATDNRRTLSIPKSTFRYEAPERWTSITTPISRSYDMWSLGCVILEFIIWLLYGVEELQGFNRLIERGFFEINDDHTITHHPKVRQWSKHMEEKTLGEKQGKCYSGALRDLLDMVVKRLLIFENRENASSNTNEQSLSTHIKVFTEPATTENRTHASKTERAKSKELCDKLSQILSLSNTDSTYIHDLSVDMPSDHKKGPLQQSLSLRSKRDTLRPPSLGESIAIPDFPLTLNSDPAASTQYPYGTPYLTDTWSIHCDNSFADALFSKLTLRDHESILPPDSTPRTLCCHCSDTHNGIFFPGFSIRWAEVESSRHSCSLCSIIYRSRGSSSDSLRNISVSRNSSWLTTNAAPELSIVVGPGLNYAPLDLQKGFPALLHYEHRCYPMLLQHWINDCNIKHVCRPKDPVLPKRLIDLSATKNPGILKLDCSKDRSDSNYAALSHRWGDPNLHREFRLQKDNLSQWQRQLELKKLPKTFRDAVTITRMLGIRYLWIDSLCIVQNSIEDWRAECQKMEEVFSSAYVTLSATCSNGTSDGFLKPHPEEGPKARTYSPINVPTANGRSSRVYICNAIDDFKRDVEEAELSTRGWVFQERALSRRVLHFTDTQMYWECGKGVRCETMMRMYNRKSSFLSDPNFPESMASHYKGMRIIFFENIYEKYSQLSFTYWRDRAVALAGIERRLARVYATRARYGILDHSDRSYLRRSLLWQRAVSDAAPREQHSLPKIEFGAGQEVPSWSWMAVMGAIEYMPVPFDVVDWDASLKWVSESEKREELVGRAKDADGSGNIEGIIWDRPEESERENLRMVIVGTERTYGVGDVSKHYVIVVASIPGPSGVVWERVGVGAVVKEPGWIEGLTWIRVE